MSVKKKSIILLQGVFKDSAFDMIAKKRSKEIFILEGRPGLDAAKRSCQALIDRSIRPTLITDNMAGFLFYKKLVKEVWMSYQTADKERALCQIGGLILGVLGRRHKIPVYLYPNKQKLQLMGYSNDISFFNGVRIAPTGIKGYVPLVEWVPREYMTKIYE